MTVVLELIRIAYGVLEIARPSMTVAGPASPDPAVRAMARVLGARYLVQGLLTARGGAAAHRAGGAIDVLHAASMVALAAGSPRLRTAAGSSARIAAAFAALELV